MYLYSLKLVSENGGIPALSIFNGNINMERKIE